MMLPDTMRAAVLSGNGGPEMIAVRSDVAVPAPGPDEVLVRVAACGMNNTDINTRVGWYSRSVDGATSSDAIDDVDTTDSTWGGAGVTFPRIQGADICGRIVDADSGSPDSRVVVDPWVRSAEDPSDRSLARYLGSELDGGFAEYCAVPARNVHSIESDLSDEQLATFACSWSTAEHMLQRVGLTSGQTIVVTGASGGVGTALMQLSHRRGARVVAVAGASKADQVAAAGADHVVVRGNGSIDAAVDAAGGPIDVVADVVGGPDFDGWLNALRRGGRFVTSGAIGGPRVELDLRTLYLNDLEVFGATVVPSGVFADLVGYIGRGEVCPVLAASYPLEQIEEAQAAFVTKAHVGNIVLTI
jgi:NADPH:quinone reductase-like Zn-dependent oxidoreductase